MSPSALLSGSAQEDASNSSDGIDDGSDSSHSNSDSGSESEKDIEHFYLQSFLIIHPSIIRGVGNSVNACLKILQYLPI